MATPTFTNNFNQPLLHVIYKISGPGTHYIGITTDFNQEMGIHEARVNNGSNTPFYSFIRENGGWNAFKKELLEARIMGRDEALIRLAELIREHSTPTPGPGESQADEPPPVKPKQIQFTPSRVKRTPEEQREYKRVYNQYWRQKNDEKYKQYLKEWRASHPNYAKKWRDKAKEETPAASAPAAV